MSAPKPVVCCILDGWGYSPKQEHNAIAAADTPNWDRLISTYPNGLIQASEHHVGLPSRQMGNSEVGHMNIGAGRVVMQDLPRIDAAIHDKSLKNSSIFKKFVLKLQQTGGSCHLLGLISDGGVHSHQHHITTLAFLLADEGIEVFVHAFLDGRDTAPRSGLGFLREFRNTTETQPTIHLATLSGRYYAMDRDKRWERTERAFQAIVDANAPQFPDFSTAMHHAYDEMDVGDEFVEPCILKGYQGMKDGDGLLMANFRADRARQILHALVDPNFDGFERERRPHFADICGMVHYSDELSDYMHELFPSEDIHGSLGELVSRAGKKQMRLAETEKYAHVTFFMSGGREAPFEGEERVLIPSPKVATYDLQPEMAAAEVTGELLKAITSGAFDLIIVNYANADMVGHTGDFNAAVKAVRVLDACLGPIAQAVKAAGGAMLITADHGNIEMMKNSATEQAHTAHTRNPVPLILVHPDYEGKPVKLKDGQLADIAPTLLGWLGIEQPPVMTGKSLLPSAETLNAA